MSTSSKTTEKYDKDKEFYLECLGHLMNLEFEPRSNLTLKVQNPPKKTENVPGNSKKLRNANAAPKPSDSTSCTIENISTEKAKTWKAGAISATMKKLGFPVREANSSIRPLKANTLEERLEVLNIFQFETTKLKSRSGREESSKQETNKGKAHANNESGNHKRPHSPDEFDSKKLKKDFLPPSSVDSKRPRLKNELQSEPEIQTMYSRVPSDKSKPFVEPSKDASRVKFQKMPSSVGFSNSLPSAKDSEANAHNAQSRRLVAANNSKPENVITEDAPSKHNMFLSAYDKLLIEDKRKGIVRNLGAPSEKVRIPGLFKPPIKNNNNDASKSPVSEPNNEKEPADLINPELAELLAHEKLKVFEPKIIEAILSEVMEQQQLTNWKDIAGLEGPKAIIKEIIIWPMLRPDIFTGLRSSPRGILLFGPPGTGKTMIGRLIATQSSSTFFNISASSLTSKWIGDGEKMVRCLFQVARIKQPSVIFIDEIDSILTQRSESEHESSRRLKTEFLIQFDGCGTKSEDRVLVIGVTNRPQELDEAARRRLVKRIYIPLPDLEGRKQIVNNLMQDQNVNLTTQDILRIAEITEGYSGADMKSLCQDASYGPIREIGHMLENIVADKVRPIQLQDFIFAQKRVKSSVAEKDLEVYEKWDESFGCHIEQ